MKTKNIYMLTLLAGITLPAMAQSDIADSVAYKDQTVDIGANRLFTREQSTAIRMSTNAAHAISGTTSSDWVLDLSVLMVQAFTMHRIQHSISEAYSHQAVALP